MTAPPIVGLFERFVLAQLARKAAADPVDVAILPALVETKAGHAAHVARMSRLSLMVGGWCVTYSIEHGHPIGPVRHASVCSPSPDRVPTAEAVWALVRPLGFRGSLGDCTLWVEEFGPGQRAVNVLQVLEPAAVAAE